MPAGANVISTTIPLQDAIKKLSRYFGLYTVQDLAGRIALSQIQGRDAEAGSFDLPQPPAHITKIIELLIDTSTGGYTSNDIVNGINRSLQAGNPNPLAGEDIVKAVNESIQIVFGAGDGIGNPTSQENTGVLKGSRNRPEDSIQSIVGSSTINSNIVQPNRETAPSLSMIMMNSVRVLPIHKNVNAVTVFLNGVPNLEISRCVPHLDIQFQFGRPPTAANGQIQTMGLIKFLDGAEVATNGTRRLLLDANLISGSLINGTNEQYTTAGMEVFTSPQMLVNANEDLFQTQQGTARRSAPVLDKFRPFMSFKSLNIEVIPTTGFMCFKSAKMDFVLHDRSRVAEIADFIRPDLYSNTEILIEYGWSHPDHPSVGNPYADLLNGMRCREKYGIINASMQFDEAGQANVSLSLAMRGASDFRTEVISSDENGTGTILREINALISSIAELRRRTFQNNAPGTKEVRGIQILDAASDSSGQLLLTPSLRQELQNFRAALRNTNNPSARGILAQLDNLYGSNGKPGQVRNLRGSIQQNIARKLARISRGGADIFSASTTANRTEGRGSGRRFVSFDTASRQSFQQADQILRSLDVSPTVTLGKIFTIFLGQPLANSHKFDDIQILTYPFNAYAGYASTLNIANFEVDTRFFLQEYTRYRMESINRAGNLSLQDFINFIATVVIEDPAAPSYGLRGKDQKPFYRTVTNEEGVSSTESTAVDSLALQTRIEEILRGVTPDGSFKLPQLDYYIECLPRNRNAIPEGQNNQGSDSLSILRVHIFDKNTTSYDTQAALLEANREDELRVITSLPQRTGGNEGVRKSQDETSSAIIQAAINAGLIEQIPNSNPIAYRTRGGPEKIKEFMMKTSPYIIVGSQGSLIKTASLSTQQDPQLSTVNLLRSFHADPLEPNGESPGGLPLQVIPCDLSLGTWGCPLLDYGTKFFLDMKTGTTIDNYYFVVGLSHKLEQGSFFTDVKLAPYDGWGKYRSLIETVRSAQLILTDIENNTNQ